MNALHSSYASFIALFAAIPWQVWAALIFSLKAAQWFLTLWILFLAVMKLQDVDKSGVLATLDWRVQKLARLVLIIGLGVNAFVRVFLTWLVFLEWPRWGEWGVSAQVQRLWSSDAEGWRKERAKFWRDNVLGPFDATKRHG